MSIILHGTVLLSLFSGTLGSERFNVLFLMMDDLRPNIEIIRDARADGFVSPPMHTPNLDTLASRSLVLKQAYVQQAICAPSRTSLLTSRRPETTKVYGFEHYWREHAGNFTTLPQYFKENGYISIGMGKVFHGRQSSNNHDSISWSVPFYDGDYHHETKARTWAAIPDDLLSERPLVDQQIADRAIARLRALGTQNDEPNRKPFFLAVGFHKPHLPFVFPKSMLDKYPADSIQLPTNPYAPIDMPEIAWNANHIFGKYKDLRKKKLPRGFNATIPDKIVRDLRRAYYCSVSWADQQLGRVLQELRRQGFHDKTIIVFLSDHGYELGEHGLWTKFSNFELALRAPIMIHIPGKTTSMLQSKQLVEFVDLFPSLVEAAGLDPLPLCPKDSSKIALCREGESFLSLLVSPDKPIKTAAFSVAKRRSMKVMGYSIRTPRYRYTAWVKFDKRKYKPKWRRLIAEELYDHQLDWEENRNVAASPAHIKIARKLRKKLKKGWRQAVL